MSAFRTRATGLLLGGLLVGGLTGQQHFDAHVDVGRITGLPSMSPDERNELFAKRAREAFLAVQQQLSPVLDDARETFTLRIADRTPELRKWTRSHCRQDLQGLGVVDGATRTFVLAPTKKQRDGALLTRTTAHATALLAVETILSQREQDRLGYGFLSTGLAHRASMRATSQTDTFVVRRVIQSPVLAWSGNLRIAASTLFSRGHLPPLRDLLVTESSDFDLAQHALALALVDWLASQNAAATHGNNNEPGPLAKLVEAARTGKASTAALQEILDADLASIEKKLIGFVVARRWAKLPNKPLVAHKPHPHAAVYVYTGEPVRKRHRKIVAKALKQRHAAHTSGWQKGKDRKPTLQLGPVNRKAGFWHQDDLVKSIPRTWPMVAVLEYDGSGEPVAYLDCLRRVTSQKGEDGWMLDPNVGFVGHHNAQVVTDEDDDFHYLAIPDTPTGSHVGGSEFVHRGRVRWQNGQFATVGVSTRMHAPKSRSVEPWHAIQTPLCDWRVVSSSKKRGATSVAAVQNPDRELAIWGTDRVHRFPPIPDGLTAGN